jgi:hypothetical protein
MNPEVAVDLRRKTNNFKLPPCRCGKFIDGKVGFGPKVNVMFTIELVVVAGDRQEQPRVVERVTPPRPFLGDVEHMAKLFLRKAKRQPSPNSANGYQILDGEGHVITRSWDRLAHAEITVAHKNVDVLLGELKQFANERNVDIETFQEGGLRTVSFTIPLAPSAFVCVHNAALPTLFDLMVYSHDDRSSWVTDWELLIDRLRALLGKEHVTELGTTKRSPES